MTSRWIPMGEVARLLHLSRPTARKYLLDGRVPGRVDWFGQARVDREVFEKWHFLKDLGKKGKPGKK